MSKIDPHKLLISSDFYTVQGEGISSGVPSYFVRFGICNLTCGMSRAFTNMLAKEQKLEDGEIFEGDLHKEGNADFNRAGSFLHNKFFPQLRAPKTANRPRGAVLALIEEKFKTFEDFREQFKETAMKIQGSGWVYLSTGGDIKTIANHAVRTDICVLVDWWEHAWALDYQSDKEAYLNNIWKVIDWDVCNERL